MLSCRTLDSAPASRSHTGSYRVIFWDNYDFENEIEDHHSGSDDYETGAGYHQNQYGLLI